MIVPASSGLMGILPSHAPTVAQLRSGVVEIHEGEAKESYFVSSGFAFVHKDRTDVCAVEAVKVRLKTIAIWQLAREIRGCLFLPPQFIVCKYVLTPGIYYLYAVLIA